jgi:hypothetical protein
MSRTFSKSLNPIGTTDGTFTLNLQDDSLSDAEGQTTSVSDGFYSKIGGRVFFNGRLTMTSLGTLNTSNQARISGLPFTSSSTTNSEGGAIITFFSGLGSVVTWSVTGVIPTNSTVIELYESDGGTAVIPLTVLGVASVGVLYFQGQYPT